MTINNLVLTVMGSNPGGIELQMPALIRHLHKYQPLLYLVHGMRTRENCVLKNTGITPIRGARGLPRSTFDLFHFARKQRDRTFQVYNIGPLFLLVLRLAGVSRIIYCIRGTIYGKTLSRKLLIRSLWKLALSAKITIISNSDYSAAKFRELIWPGAKIKTVYNPIDIDRFLYLKPGYSSTPRKVVYVGRLAPGKNVQLWIEIANHLGKRYPEMEFHIYGGGSLQHELEQFAATLDIRDRITLHGHTPDIAEAYRTADLMIFLSQYESFGNVVVESILSGTPVICSAIPALREIFEHYPKFLIPLDEDITEAILAKVEDYVSLVQLAKRAQTDFSHRFSIEKHVGELETIYNQLAL